MKIAEIKSLELTILQKNYSFQHIQLIFEKAPMDYRVHNMKTKGCKT